MAKCDEGYRCDVCGEDVANILVQEGFSNIEEVAYVPESELLDIAEFDEEIVSEIRRRARDALLTQLIAKEEILDENAPEEDLMKLEGMTERLALRLAEKGVRTVDLPDGSRVFLNEGASISYPSAFSNERNIELNGEAFFEVMSDPMNPDVNHKETYSLWDVYPHADLITYPSLYEGFGNAFLEAVYFKKPLLINRYATFVQDIEPKGFDLIAMDGYLTRKTVSAVKIILNIPERRAQMVDTNYEVAARYYSYAVLRRWLNIMLTNFFGTDP